MVSPMNARTPGENAVVKILSAASCSLMRPRTHSQKVSRFWKAGTYFVIVIECLEGKMTNRPITNRVRRP